MFFNDNHGHWAGTMQVFKSSQENTELKISYGLTALRITFLDNGEFCMWRTALLISHDGSMKYDSLCFLSSKSTVTSAVTWHLNLSSQKGVIISSLMPCCFHPNMIYDITKMSVTECRLEAETHIQFYDSKGPWTLLCPADHIMGNHRSMDDILKKGW